MRRLALLLTLVTALAAPAAAAAHPLGNFTTNRYTAVEVSGDRIYLLAVLDLAEIPSYQARAEARRLGRDGYARTLTRRIGAGLRLTVGGESRPLRVVSHRLAFPRGAGGLATTRFELVLDAGRARGEVELALEDTTFPGRIGWREIVVRGTSGARVESASVPARSVSGGLRAYPDELLASPLEVFRARARVKPGTGESRLPGATEPEPEHAEEDGFAALVDDDLSAGVVIVSLLAALFWGAAHALTPGHGKAIVAAYLVGARGRARHAFALGGIVTVTHTIGVFALGLVTLALSELVVPEDLYPWLNLAAALLVVGVGLAVLRARVREWLHRRAHAHGHHHQHHHDHHHHDHDHTPPPGSGVRGLVAVGISGGLLPCPTALVVLLAAISLHRVGYGLLLIVAFSVGLASVVTAIGLLAVGARRTFARLDLDRPAIRALPAVSAVVIVALGVAMTVRSLPALT